ncbi:LysR family transcriptional regulator, partial [Pseudomonas aeruginosa]|nr:LysR family transcriptional regulator [Pseudomonas aeruginosa]MBF3157155.1 LysR family transcriptional regulator [Pseudomonas aeruginosa]MBF3307020.1 LysR family transcriptional regulator [Pseudomonas aeruginosa]HCG0441363.1 LysR family transcriptional regulator [Pseudomonas aeruginosa]
MAGWETHKKAQWLCQLRKGMSMLPDTLSEQFVLYLDVLDGGSFSAAARKHPLTPSAVARRMDALERAVGSTLLVRTTHAV